MKNIMLIFLSDIPNKNITVSKYRLSDGTVVETMHTAESAIAELFCKIKKIDKIFAFVTAEVACEKELTLVGGEKFAEGVLKFFKKRVSKDNGYIAEEDIIVCEYRADKNVEDSLDNIALMAHKILKETKQFKDEEIYIHADMTGGLRSASMMMLGIMRFLEFSNYKLGNVLYSNWVRDRELNWVENAEGIYRFFDLVAGGKEFTHFGSVKEIIAYFKDQHELSTECRELIGAMKMFSENIKLCHYGKFVASIKKLKEAVENFEIMKYENANINDKLMKIMLPTVKREYHELLLAVDDDLSIIDWCVKREYLQQAMTLYTERIPEYIFDKKILYIMPEQQSYTEQQYQKYAEKDGGSFYFYAFNGMMPGDKTKKLIEKAVFEKYKTVFTNISNGTYEIEKLQQALAEYKYPFIEGVSEYLQDKYISVNHNENAVAEFFEVLSKVRRTDASYNNIAENTGAAGKLFGRFLSLRSNEVNVKKRNNTVKNFIRYCANGLDLASIGEYFGVQIELKKEYKISLRWRTINKYYNNIYGSELDDIDALRDIINDYNWIKYERNASNHARKGVIEVTASEIEKKITDGIAAIRRVRK